MKKILAILLMLTFVVVLFAACGKEDQTIHDLGSATPAQQETAVANAAPTDAPAQPADLSSDWRSWQLEIDGVIYTLPIKVSDFFANGWTFGVENEMIEPENGYMHGEVSNGSSTLDRVYTHNFSSQYLPETECYITEIWLKRDYRGNFTLPGGLNLWQITKETIRAAWGEPEYEGNTSFEYCLRDSEGSLDRQQGWHFYFDASGALESITVNNDILTAREASTPTAPAATPTAPAQTTAPYVTQAPAASTAAYINLTALQSIESSDPCPVKITQKQLIDDYYKGKLVGIGESGDDACVFTITNNSGADLKEVVFLAVGYKANKELMKIGGTITFFGEDKYVVQFTTQDTEIKAGSSEKIGIRCDGAELNGVCAIVYSYTTADGTVHTNDTATQWYQNVYQPSKTF